MAKPCGDALASCHVCGTKAADRNQKEVNNPYTERVGSMIVWKNMCKPCYLKSKEL